ncbi:hypothetical protein F4780DRAFT_58005 [Xylariomycetidae sp. FL0641]|nr:hypothetical protein F4780DRAFT_58005 [Xylariomycetidae sp. FL0641]
MQQQVRDRENDTRRRRRAWTGQLHERIANPARDLCHSRWVRRRNPIDAAVAWRPEPRPAPSRRPRTSMPSLHVLSCSIFMPVRSHNLSAWTGQGTRTKSVPAFFGLRVGTILGYLPFLYSHYRQPGSASLRSTPWMRQGELAMILASFC